MPDSPKCKKCMSRGDISQTYRIVRTRTYKCATCGWIDIGPFDDREFMWKESPDSWKAWEKTVKKDEVVKDKPKDKGK